MKAYYHKAYEKENDCLETSLLTTLHDFLLPLGQIHVGKAQSDASVGSTGPTFDRTNHLAQWTQHIGSVHDAAQVNITGKACRGQVIVIFDALPCFLGATQSHVLSRCNFHVRCFLVVKRGSAYRCRLTVVVAVIVRRNFGCNRILNRSGTGSCRPIVIVVRGHFGRNEVSRFIISLKGNAWLGGRRRRWRKRQGSGRARRRR